VPQPNYAFHNNGDLTFTNLAAAWGLDAAGFSTAPHTSISITIGALEYRVNNLNAPGRGLPQPRARPGQCRHHYLTVALRGSGANTAGLGAKVKIAGRRYPPTRRSGADARLRIIGRSACAL